MFYFCIMITIEDFKPHITTGLFDVLNITGDTEIDKLTEEQVENAINSAIAEYKLYVPCFCVENNDVFEALKHIALPQIARILSYQTLPLIPSANTDTKSQTERLYAELKRDLEGELGGANGTICSILKPVAPQQDFNPVQIANLETIGR